MRIFNRACGKNFLPVTGQGQGFNSGRGWIEIGHKEEICHCGGGEALQQIVQGSCGCSECSRSSGMGL